MLERVEFVEFRLARHRIGYDVAAVVAFAVGILVGVNSTFNDAPSTGAVLSNAIAANTDVPGPGDTSPDRMTNIERLDAEIAVLNMLEHGIAERNDEYKALISEIARLLTVKSTLEVELGEAVFVPRVASGR